MFELPHVLSSLFITGSKLESVVTDYLTRDLIATRGPLPQRDAIIRHTRRFDRFTN